MDYLKDETKDEVDRCEFTFVINEGQGFKIYVSKITNNVEITTFTPDLVPNSDMTEEDVVKYIKNHPVLIARFNPDYESKSVKIEFLNKKEED